MKQLLKSVIAVSALVLAIPALAATQLTWYGHSSYKIVTPSGKTVLIDPWINNPTNPNAKKDMEALDDVSLILATHGHFDHIADATAIAENNPTAMLVSTLELGKAMVKHMKFPEGQFNMGTAGFPGGEISLLDGVVLFVDPDDLIKSSLILLNNPILRAVISKNAIQFAISETFTDATRYSPSENNEAVPSSLQLLSSSLSNIASM